MQGLGNLFSVQAGRENWGGSEGSPKTGMSGTYCHFPSWVWGREWECWLLSEILPMAELLNSLKHQGCSPAMGTHNSLLRQEGSELVIPGFVNSSPTHTVLGGHSRTVLPGPCSVLLSAFGLVWVRPSLTQRWKWMVWDSKGRRRGKTALALDHSPVSLCFSSLKQRLRFHFLFFFNFL